MDGVDDSDGFDFSRILELPYEMQVETFVQIRFPDLIRFCSNFESQHSGFYKICKDNLFWKAKVQRDFRWRFPEVMSLVLPEKESWKSKYLHYLKVLGEELLSLSKAFALEESENPKQDSKEILQLLDFGIDPNIKFPESGRTALHWLVDYDVEYKGRPKFFTDDPNAHYLTILSALENGGNPNVKDVDGYTPLHSATSVNDNPEVVSALLDYGADMYVEAEKYLPIELSHNPDVWMSFIDHGFDPTLVPQKDLTALALKLEGPESEEVVEALLKMQS